MASRVDELLQKPVITPTELGEIIGSSRNSIYEALRRGDFEWFPVGKKMAIPTAPLRKKLGMP